MNKVEHRRSAGNVLESRSVSSGRGLQVWGVHRHRMDLFRPERSSLDQTLTQVSEISIRVSLWCDTLIYLEYVYMFPRHILCSQQLQHSPRSSATANGDGK